MTSASIPAVLSVGEALIDWLCLERGQSLAEATNFTRAPGGAPLNVAVGLARLGVPVGFVGCVSGDPFGVSLRNLMQAEGIDTRHVRTVSDRETRMAYVVTNAQGDRQLAAFSRIACADAALAPRDLPSETLAAAPCLYFGSLILKERGPREAVMAASAEARRGHAMVIFDPNVRPVLWPDADELKRVLQAGFSRSDVIKLGADELAVATGEGDPVTAAHRLLDAGPAQVIVVTDGALGAWVVTPHIVLHVPAFSVPAVDTTGAGDAFVAGLISGILSERAADERLPSTLARLDDEAWTRVLRRASALGALATTRAGAIAALPTADVLAAFLARH